MDRAIRRGIALTSTAGTAGGTHPLLGERYVGYAYAYPHKTAYRPLPPRPLADVWRDHPRHALFLYIHIPFCAMRCGFCNLFATTGGDLAGYLAALGREAAALSEALG